MEYKETELAQIIRLSENDLEFNKYVPYDAQYLPSVDYEDLDIPTTLYRDKVKIGGANVNVTVEVPDEIISQNPSIIAHGFCGSEHAYSGLRNAMARNGTVAVSYDAPRTQKVLQALHPKHLNGPSLLLSQALWASTKQSMSIFHKEGINVSKKFDAIAHSMGGRSATLTALHRPGHFRSVLLNEAAGLEEQTLAMMLARLPEFAKEIPGTDLNIIFGGLKYIMKNPIKTLAEGIAVSQTDIREKVKLLGKFGIKSAIIVGRSDNLIPAGKVAKSSGTGVADIFAVYAEKSADHLYLQKEPFKAAMAQVEVLSMLQNATSKRDSKRYG